MTIDVESTVRQINNHLTSRGFKPRDADGSDFARPDVSSLRFKTGTSYGEVAITVWDGATQVKALRVLSDARLPEVLHEIDLLMDLS